MELDWDELLKIKTSGRDDTNSDHYHYPYEPTPYSVLERLANSGYIGKKDVLIDFGCGKGIVDFFLAYQTRCKAVGVEYDERIYNSALENLKNAVSGRRVSFTCQDAISFNVEKEMNRFYFFNPFSIEIMRAVMSRILESYYENPRELRLFFYYPSDEFRSYLTSMDELELLDEIYCGDLFKDTDGRERIVIFRTAEQLY